LSGPGRIIIGMPQAEERGVIKHPPTALTLPCTLLQLHNWMKDAHISASGAGAGAQVTGSATSLAVT
jgi:hypothetical protein